MSSTSLLQLQHQLKSYLDKAELVQATAEQIMKDLGMFGIAITFSGDTAHAYEELHQQLTHQIDILLKNARHKLISILYRIDLSEEQLRQGFQTFPAYNQTETTAHLIIARELQKVLSRKLGSQSNTL